MKENKSFELSYLPLLIRLKCCEAVTLPPYLGSTLHGILGWALLPHKELYRYLFENRRLGGKNQDIVNPYLIDPPPYHEKYRQGDELCFRLVLIGDAAKFGSEVANALGKAGGFKLGAGRKRFELVEILQGERYFPLWGTGKVTGGENRLKEKVPDDRQPGCSHCSVHMQTPLRIRKKGELVTDIDFPRIMRNITRRITELTERYGGYVNQEEAEKLVKLSETIERTSSGIYINHMERFSNRHNEKMDWSGVMGAVTFAGELEAFTPWLSAARVLHMGRNVTLGYGKVDISFC